MISKATAFKAITPVGVLISLLLLQYHNLQNLKTPSEPLSAAQLNQQEATISLRLSFLKWLPTFGFQNLMADWTFLNFIQYFGESEERAIAGYANSTDFFNVIIDRDPRFMGAYLYLTNTVSVYAGQPKEAIRLMEQGLATMAPNIPPKSYLVWRYKGIDEMLFTGDNQAAQQSFEMAADWADQASDDESTYVAQASRQTAAFLATDPNSRPALISGWMSVLNRAIDDNVRQEAIDQIEALGGQVLVANDGQVTVRYQTEQ